LDKADKEKKEVEDGEKYYSMKSEGSRETTDMGRRVWVTIRNIPETAGQIERVKKRKTKYDAGMESGSILCEFIEKQGRITG